MKLISCNNCAIVIDADKLYFPHDVWKDDGHGGNEIDTELAVWTGDGYSAFTHCPNCGAQIIKAEIDQ